MSARITGSVARYPARASFIGFLLLIAVGALLLRQPFCQVANRPSITTLEAVFTSTSAACVTGLTVRSTGQDFSFAGQVVILVLIQAGGVGIMTFSTFIVLGLGGKQGLRQWMTMAQTLGVGSELDIRRVLRQVLLFCAVAEGLGFLLLAARNLFDLPWQDALWHALFHSISAFCNAGFGLYDNNLERFAGDPLTLLVISGLVMAGGMGFPVLLDLRRNWRGSWAEMWDRLSLHSKLMLLGTAALLGVGTAAVLVLEWDNVLRDMPWWKKLLNAFFQAVVPRTAGFNSVAIGSLTNATLFIIVLLMMIGAGPCSTAGGFKVSTFVILVLRSWGSFRGERRVNLFRRTIPPQIEEKSTAASLSFAAVATAALTLLLVFEQSMVYESRTRDLFLDGLFEVISALGTVGLSTGITAQVTAASQCVLILCMFIGRLGPVSVAAALSRGEQERRIEYASEEPLIG